MRFYTMEMINEASKLHRELLQQSKLILEQQVSFLKKTSSIVKKAAECIRNINSRLKEHQFTDERTEVEFFKNVLPPIYAQHHIYITLYKLESEKPIIETKAEGYFVKNRQRMEEYLEANENFYKYYLDESTHFDAEYFIRRDDYANGVDWFMPILEPAYITPYSLKVAYLQAYEFVKNYIDGILQKLKDNAGLSDMPLLEQRTTNPKKLRWTGSKVGAVELCYALFANKCINDGKAPIYQIVNHFEQQFDISLPFPQRTMQDVANRKQGPTVQLDEMKRDLNSFIDRVFLKPYNKK